MLRVLPPPPLVNGARRTDNHGHEKPQQKKTGMTKTGVKNSNLPPRAEPPGQPRLSRNPEEGAYLGPHPRPPLRGYSPGAIQWRNINPRQMLPDGGLKYGNNSSR